MVLTGLLLSYLAHPVDPPVNGSPYYTTVANQDNVPGIERDPVWRPHHNEQASSAAIQGSLTLRQGTTVGDPPTVRQWPVIQVGWHGLVTTSNHCTMSRERMARGIQSNGSIMSVCHRITSLLCHLSCDKKTMQRWPSHLYHNPTIAHCEANSSPHGAHGSGAFTFSSHHGSRHIFYEVKLWVAYGLSTSTSHRFLLFRICTP